ncbi:MAG: aspartate/glutamate racemase family protein [bacterium]|nr:aspartate/glutamate racemase family protein [Acidimicrobiia bacterium]MCY4651217.1 aspartate/glutamate racemase family protein [bacterium]
MSNAPPRVVMINPNSTEYMTRQLAEAASETVGDQMEVGVITNRDGPAAIESDQDVLDCASSMLKTLRNHPADAYVVGCFSDPGLAAAREEFDVPVFGIAESSIHIALQISSSVGIIAGLDKAIPRHAIYWEKLGATENIVGEIACGRGVLDLESEEAYQDVRTAGAKLREEGAEVLVLGCAGMVEMADRLAADLGIPVVEPCRAALQRAARVLARRG